MCPSVIVVGSKKKYLQNITMQIILLLVIAIILFLSLSIDIVEGMRNKNSKKHRNRGNRVRRHRNRRNNVRRHRWLRGPNTRIYDTDGYYWGGWRALPPLSIYDYYPSWFYTAKCKSGCAYLGNGSVGCVNPTNTPDSCIFASDCYGC